MRLHSAAGLAAAVIVAGGGPTSALEKTTALFADESRSDEWTAGANCDLRYYNFCTGWVWVWSNWGSGDRLGACFESCCGGPSQLDASWLYAWTGSPSGYGFTGTIEVSNADAGFCPTGLPLASQPFLPISGWNGFAWGVTVGARFVVTATHGAGSFPNPASYVTDHPAAGPTGPAPCGTCYPSTRTIHSFYFGTSSSPFCPGVPFDDGTCNAELIWDTQLTCTVPVESATWGSIKALYR